MPNRPEDVLAKNVEDGKYKPVALDGCSSLLPLDRNPHIVRSNEFILFSDPEMKGASPPEYLILQPYKLFLDASAQNEIDHKTSPSGITAKLVKPMAKHVIKHRAAAATGGTALRAKAEIEEEIKTKLLDAADSGGFGYDPQADNGSFEDYVGKVLEGIFLPTNYRPFKDPHPHFALLVTYEQLWTPTGYTRGELINAINLAPGEQLTIEFRSWDKSTSKTEEELTQESELKTSEKMTQRDVLTVHQEVSRETNLHLNANLKIPIQGVPLNLTADVSNKVNSLNKKTLENTREQTVEASNVLKNSRKLRVEVSREVGREDKQTRVITNKNMCHTLNCQYFEIMANYLVTTHRVSVIPCLLFPNPQVLYTAHWVLCFEDVLKQVLIDKTFLPGFEAAHLLEANDRLADLRKADAKLKTSLGTELTEYKTEITKIYTLLKGDLNLVKRNASDCVWALIGGPIGWAVCVAVTSGLAPLRETLYMAILQLNKDAINALDTLSNTSKPANEAMQSFFAAVNPRDFQYNPITASIAKGLDALGVPSDLVNALLGWGLLDLVADDRGLNNAVQSARARLDQLMEAPPAPPAGQPVAEQGFSMMDVAHAQVNFEQLRCHIDNNWAHYLEAIWMREHPNQRLMRLQSYGSVAAIIRNELLGFYGHKAAYPIINTAVIDKLVNSSKEPLIPLQKILDDIRKDIDEEKPRPQLITVPTPGAILEAVVGQCDACEDFIQKSRVLDLKVQEAKAREEEAEASRYENRLTANPPQLDDPIPTRGQGAIKVDLKQEK